MEIKMNKRPEVKLKELEIAMDYLLANLNHGLKKHGSGIFLSKHEILGIITEEYYELIEAIHKNNSQNIQNELFDLGAVCLFAIASILTVPISQTTQDRLDKYKNTFKKREGKRGIHRGNR